MLSSAAGWDASQKSQYGGKDEPEKEPREPGALETEERSPETEQGAQEEERSLHALGTVVLVPSAQREGGEEPASPVRVRDSHLPSGPTAPAWAF